MPYKVLALAAAAAALAMLAPLPERYDVFLRIVVSAVGVWGAVVAVGEGRPAWAVGLAVLATVFNPFYAAAIGEAAWAVLSVVMAAALAASAGRVGRLIEPSDPHGDQP